MYTIELGSRLASYMTTPNVMSMKLDERTALIDSINAALVEFYQSIPNIHSRGDASCVLQAPRTIDISVTQYSTIVGSSPFTEGERGCTIRIAGDDRDNEIAGDGTLKAQYLGATGTQSATIYHDAACITGEITQVVGYPILDNGKVLQPRQSIRSGEISKDIFNKETGCPRCFFVTSASYARGSDVNSIIHFYPMPMQEYRVDMLLEMLPTRVTFQSLQLQQPIPAPAYVENILIPFCLYRLSLTKYFTGDRQNAQTSYQMAIQSSRLLNPQPVILRPQKGTRYGF